MKETPIIFSGPMVTAILNGQKTMTRRVIKDQESVEPILDDPTKGNWVHRNTLHPCDYACTLEPFDLCPYGKLGDRLYVRESFAVMNKKAFDAHRPAPFGLRYKADPETSPHLVFRPSIHMPRWASRITLEITGVRVERLQEINEYGARKEGIRETLLSHVVDKGGSTTTVATARDTFLELWDKINGKKYPWKSNPWVWVIEFQKLT